MGTHYEALGVSPTADTRTIRAAYLAKARVHHPDRNLEAAPAARARAARSMREANAAWAVLGDPAARRDYDSTLAAARRAAVARAAPQPAAPTSQPRREAPSPREPWLVEDAGLEFHDRLGCSIRVLPTIVILLLLLGIFVFTAFAATRSDDAPSTRLSVFDLLPGDCLRVEPVLGPVACTSRHDAEVLTIESMSRGCPAGTAVYPLDGTRVACLRPVP